MISKSRHHWFPVWHYLNQPLFDTEIKFILHPSKFWKSYRLEYLNRCWLRQCLPHHDPQI
ncbi:MAG: hypothetical protein HC851_01080 [Acaryochloris sp. RU_4_1]|nr:hypothetical protein [Acaryochloris sp. SU_5_25]NJM64345.1 hypothetical protein [Acaryochloris sp. RU_4_1]NJN39062.1 hypothetical protein [Acaryochloridaceae cyanobacterium CSU_3_4]NJR53636.1 hypothetical protein [Acaryochloris sp. CRU_2_0]